MAEMVKELAVISNVKFGVFDLGHACVWFNMHGLHGSTLWVLRTEAEIMNFVNKSQCRELKDMEGKPCVVKVGKGEMRFVRMLDWAREEGEDD